MFETQGPVDCHVCNNCHAKIDRDYRLLPHSTPNQQQNIKRQQISSCETTPKKGITKKRRVVDSPLHRKLHVTSTPKHKQQLPFHLRHTRRGKLLTSIMMNLQRYKYATAFRRILALGERAKHAFNLVVKQQCFQQIRLYVSNDQDFPQLNGIKSVQEFGWQSLIQNISHNLPTLIAALNGSMSRNIRTTNAQMQ